MRHQIIGAMTAAVLFGGTAMAQDFPEFSINGIVQYGAGGAVDTVGRTAAAIAEQELGSKIVVTNRPGGAGVIAALQVLSQPTDGYTVMFGSADAQLYQVLGLADFDFDSFYSVNLLVEEENVILVKDDAPYEDFSALLAEIQARPGELRLANYGPGTTSHIIYTMLTSVTDFPVNVVPSDGAGPAMTSALGGAIDVVIAGVSVAKPMIDSGRLRPLAIVAPEVNSQFPNVPPITEFVPGIERFLPWGAPYGVFAHREIPDEAKETLSAAFSAAANDEAFRDVMNGRGVRILNLTGDEADAYLDRWQSITSWLLHDAGATKASPDDFGIPRP